VTRVRVGTSGWSYPEWVGPFYPEKTSTARMLDYYGRHFLAVEAHSTHRRLPTTAALERWVASVPERFRFAPKAHANITHRRDLEGVAERISAFARSLEPLGERLGPVLFVLPHRQPDLTRLDLLLKGVSELPPGPPRLHPVFELAPGWWIDEVFQRLADHRASLAAVDKDGRELDDVALPAVGPLAYVRLRRSTYTGDQLAWWADRLSAATSSRPEGVYAFIKHDERGDGPRYARALVEHLERS
jgi:uncharacterized protein YecE (DUF72 family)